MFRVCLVFLFVHCSLAATCWESADLLALLGVRVSCVSCLYGALSQVCYLIVFSFTLKSKVDVTYT